MKKVFCLLLLAMLCLCPAAYAQKNMTAAQQRVQTNIKSFLASEGYVPTMDTSDNSVKFKKAGATYWVYVEESGPYYITTQRAGYGLESRSRAAAVLAANECNSSKKAAKTYVTDESVVFVVETFVTTAAEYQRVFHRIMSVLDSAMEQFDEEYERFSE